MVGQISTILADAKLNIEGMVNQNRADLAYNLIDVSCPVSDDVVAKLKSIEGVINVRCIAG
jgi:D-3-phosphoglycerate dehydrogenase